jgi:hypothetical protein
MRPTDHRPAPSPGGRLHPATRKLPGGTGVKPLPMWRAHGCRVHGCSPRPPVATTDHVPTTKDEVYSMARQNPERASLLSLRFSGRPQTARRQSWHRWIETPDGLVEVNPAPGRTYTQETWPPRGRGRGESLTSPRRIAAKLRTCQVLQMRRAGHTWGAIARALGFRDASGPYRAYRRAVDRVDFDRERGPDRTGPDHAPRSTGPVIEGL